MRIVIEGHVPAKKNNKRALGVGRLITAPETKAQITALVFRARIAWGHRPPVERATLHAHFIVRDGRGDLDNKLTTIQDVLVEARVLRNDSIARLAKISATAEVGEPERVEVEIEHA